MVAREVIFKEFMLLFVAAKKANPLRDCNQKKKGKDWMKTLVISCGEKCGAMVIFWAGSHCDSFIMNGI